MKIVTFNIRNVWTDYDGVNSFAHRAGLILDKIDSAKPDVIAFQEVNDKIRDFLEKYLVGYTLCGHGRNADYFGEGPFTAIRNDTVRLIGLDTFWLTETPYVSSVLKNQSEIPRTCVAAVLQEKSSKKIFAVYNTHLEYSSGENAEAVRLREMEIIAGRVKERYAASPSPVFLLGDFNAEPTEAVINYCKTEFPLAIKDLTEDSGITRHGFFVSGEKNVKIDYIFADIATAAKAQNFEIWDDGLDGILLSDHYPLCIETQL